MNNYSLWSIALILIIVLGLGYLLTNPNSLEGYHNYRRSYWNYLWMPRRYNYRPRYFRGYRFGFPWYWSPNRFFWGKWYWL